MRALYEYSYLRRGLSYVRILVSWGLDQLVVARLRSCCGGQVLIAHVNLIVPGYVTVLGVA